tara:strand:+ start:164 stop:361 length:198 start_codon:yes stop_codon:yes gene_type:complete
VEVVLLVVPQLQVELDRFQVFQQSLQQVVDLVEEEVLQVLEDLVVQVAVAVVTPVQLVELEILLL